MIPGLAILEKIVIFAIDLFVRNQIRKDQLKESFTKFFKKSSEDARVSADIRDQYHTFKEDKSWQNKSE